MRAPLLRAAAPLRSRLPARRAFATAVDDFFQRIRAQKPQQTASARARDAELRAVADEIIAMSRPEYLQRYGDRINERLKQLGFESLEDFERYTEGKRKEEQARVLLGLRKPGDREDVLKVKEMGAGGASGRPKSSSTGAGAASHSGAGAPGRGGAGGGAPSAAKPLSSIVQLEKFAQLDAKAIEELWTAYHADKDCLSAVVPAATYEKLMKNGGEFPMFILPLPRDKGFEFFLLQFQPPQQILFTSLHAYQTLGPSCRPYLTLTLYPDLLDAKGIALMRGEVDAEVLGKQMGVEEARMLALYMQAYYVEPNERKKELLRTFHQEPAKFNYQDVLDEIEKLV